MSALNKVSNLIPSQLPQFIVEDHPTFVQFLQKYYEFLETPGQVIYELKRFEENFDVNTARLDLLKYFKSKILPSFPDSTELSTEKIIKASRDFYAKKGTPESFKFLFRILYGQEIEVFFPKLQILRASDGKWVLPQAFRLNLSPANENFDVNLLEKRKAYGSISRASCVIETANRTIDKSTNREIVEIFVSGLNRFFLNGEFLEVKYLDVNGVEQIFSEKIIGALSNIKINPRRRGRKYLTGDPVVLNGGIDPTSTNPSKAVAVVGNVTTGSIDSVSVIKGGYGFRVFANTLIDVISANGIGSNVIVSGVNSSSSLSINYAVDSILYKASELLSSSDYGFDNTALANANTTIVEALTFETLTLSPIESVLVVNGGSFFDEEPILNAVSLYESDYSTDQSGYIQVDPGEFNTYNPSTASFRLSGGSYSSANDWYNGWRVLVEKQFRTVVDYDGATKTVFLDRKFESNINNINILSKNLFLDPRPNIQSMGRIAAVEILNPGTGYSGSDALTFIGTGYDAAGTITVSGSGSITGITLANRGEGYPIAPEVYITTSTGSGGILKAVLFADGEEFDVITSDIGQIRDFTVINRGTDYVSTPNVSLKIYDLLVSNSNSNAVIAENDIAYQGANANSTTFRASVDSFFNSGTVLRVFNYSGSPNPSLNLVISSAATGAQTNIAIVAANIAGKIYPYRYGDGRARANAEFLNGLIRYNGYYLNTDGHLSSDKVLQDADKYHNYSYSIVSGVQFKDYSKTVLDVAHPAGGKLVPIFEMRSDHLVVDNSNSNVHISTTTASSYTTDISVDYNSLIVDGGGDEYFDLVGNVGDLIIINSASSIRSFTKTIVDIAGENQLNIESSCVLVGEGRASTNATNANIKISGNANLVSAYIDVNDRISLNVGGNTILRSINSISGNIVTLNSSANIETSSNNLIYFVYPKFENVSYVIVNTTN